MKDIEGFEGLYAITREGKVWAYPRIIINKSSRWDKPVKRIWKGKFLKASTNKKKDWYMSIALQKNNFEFRKGFKIHRLVAKAFIPNPNFYPEVNHKNGIKNDNRISNLEWCSHQENMSHSWKILPKRNHNPKRKLTYKQAQKIRDIYNKKCISQRKLGHKYNVSFATIGQIIRNKSYLL